MTTAAATLDRTWIMNRAWHYIRLCRRARVTTSVKRRALQDAWYDMKVKMRGLRLPDELTPLEKELASLEAKEFTTAQERDRIEDVRKAITHENAEADYAEKRAVIEAGPCVVTFIKADGSERTMRVDPRELVRHVKGDRATNSGRRGAKTRRARHPNLMPVWDVDADAARSVNLATISRIDAQGRRHTY